MFRTIALCLALLPATVFADETRIQDVHFAAGASSTTLKGRVAGYDSVLYRVAAESGQSISVRLTSRSSSIYFNLYAPGKGPGDEALVVSELTPEINVYSGLLPASGTYAISVYLVRAAARRNEAAEFTIDLAITGATSAAVQGDFADGLAGGPDWWRVEVGSVLNLRQAPSTGAPVVVAVQNGTALQNLGCRAAEGRTWCHVQVVQGPDGWAAAEFLREGAAPASGGATGDATVAGTNFNATGTIPCATAEGMPTAPCAFGVVREGGGAETVTVNMPGGGTRVIRFSANGEVTSDSPAGIYKERKADLNLIYIGTTERYEIVDAVLFGG